MRGYAFRAFAVLAMICSPALALAQGDTGAIEGTVLDSEGGRLPGVQVTVRNAESGTGRSVFTDAQGYFRVPALLPGQYTVQAQLSGFQTVEATDLVVNLGATVAVQLEMAPGGVEETITVSGQAPLVDTFEKEVGGLITAKQIETLPVNSRQYLSLALLQPGTTQDGTRSFFPTVNVGGAVAFNATGNLVDGTINNWVEDGEPRQNLPEDAIAEFRVSNATFSAEHGLATGGLVQTVTKSGTNSFHGTAFEYFRDKSLNAIGVFESEKPEFRRHQFGGSIGGPIILDSMHFFAAYERTDVQEFYTVNTGLPEFYGGFEGTFEKPFTRDLLVGRWDWQIDQDNSVFARWAQEEETSTCGGCGGTSATGFDQETPRRSFVTGYNWFIDESSFNDFRFQHAWNAYYIAPSGTEIWNDPGSFPPERVARLSAQYEFPSFSYGSSFDEVGPESRTEVRNTYNKVTEAHNLRVGGHYSYNGYAEENTGNPLGSWTFATDQFFDPNDPEVLAGLTDAVSFSASLPPIRTDKPTQYYAFFVQDDWQVFDNLVLNLGLRWERLANCCNETIDEALPFTDVDGDPVEIPFLEPDGRADLNNFGPRLGFVLDAFDDGTTAIRGGYGIYYGHTRSLGTLNEYRNFARFSVNITDPTYPDPFGGQDPEDFIVGGPANVTVVSPDYRQPESHQFSLGVSQQLTDDLALHVDGTYIHTLHDRKIVDINPRDPETGQRPIPEFGRIDFYQSSAELKYRAMYVKLQKRYSDNYQFLVSYTLAKSEDDIPLGRSLDPFDLSLDRGPSASDRRHALVASGSFLLPWEINLGAIWTLRSQLPWSAEAGRDLNGDGFTSDLVPGTTRNAGGRDLDIAAVNAYRAANGLPAVSESDFDSTRYSSVDLRVSKTIPVQGGVRLELMAQAFNILNTTNLESLFGGGRIENALSANFGEIVTARENRQVELAVKAIW